MRTVVITGPGNPPLIVKLYNVGGWNTLDGVLTVWTADGATIASLPSGSWHGIHDEDLMAEHTTKPGWAESDSKEGLVQ